MAVRQGGAFRSGKFRLWIARTKACCEDRHASCEGSVRIAFGGLAGAGTRARGAPAHRWSLDRAGTGNPGHSPLRRLARSSDQSAGSIVRCPLAGVLERTHTQPGIAAGRELLRNNASWRGGIDACPRTFSGDTVSLTLEDNHCPPRRGTAARQAAGS